MRSAASADPFRSMLRGEKMRFDRDGDMESVHGRVVCDIWMTVQSGPVGTISSWGRIPSFWNGHRAAPRCCLVPERLLLLAALVDWGLIKKPCHRRLGGSGGKREWSFKNVQNRELEGVFDEFSNVLHVFLGRETWKIYEDLVLAVAFVAGRWRRCTCKAFQTSW